MNRKIRFAFATAVTASISFGAIQAAAKEAPAASEDPPYCQRDEILCTCLESTFCTSGILCPFCW